MKGAGGSQTPHRKDFQKPLPVDREITKIVNCKASNCEDIYKEKKGRSSGNNREKSDNRIGLSSGEHEEGIQGGSEDLMGRKV